MSTEEPAWKAELRKAVAPWAPYETKQPDDSDEYPEGLMATLLPHIQAAEERGRREALENFICGVCGHRVGWIDCPTGGWWSHAEHPADNHDAVECVPDQKGDQ